MQLLENSLISDCMCINFYLRAPGGFDDEVCDQDENGKVRAICSKRFIGPSM